jgi:creatinine amidohydrolase/Fe(II)-dependent formamide hydrolase-like protein
MSTTQAILPLAEALFRALLQGGFRNLHGVIHHQTENFAQGMPTDLAFRLAARNAIFRHLEETRGPGWWGPGEMQDYYARHAAGEDPVQLDPHPSAVPEGRRFPFDHAGEGETALMLALAPETVDMAEAGDGGALVHRSATEARRRPRANAAWRSRWPICAIAWGLPQPSRCWPQPGRMSARRRSRPSSG